MVGTSGPPDALNRAGERLESGTSDPRIAWRRTARPDQVMPDGDWRVLYFQGGRGGGKLLDVTTSIPVPGGWAKLSEINVGDEVFDESGRICRVTATFDDVPKAAYRLWFSDGTYLDACSDHQWVTWTHAERKSFLRSPYEDTSRMPAEWPAWRLRSLVGGNQYLKRDQVEPALAMLASGASIRAICESTGLSRGPLTRHLAAGAYLERELQPSVHPGAPGPQIRTTQDVVATLTFGKRGDTNHSVPVCGPLDLPEADLPVHPYVLGVWLGDGSSASSVVTSADPEVIDHIRACGETAEPTRVAADKCPMYQIGGLASSRDPLTGRMVGNGSLHSRLRKLGVLGNKHVPPAYLRASAGQRLALLQGLMDSDGSADGTKYAVEFCTTKRHLAEAVVELARSLGQKPVSKESRAKLYGRDCGPKWRVTWRPTVPVFRLSRKLNRSAQPVAQQFRHLHRMIVRAEPIEPAAMRCLTVDSLHHMYLAGEGMIPTHNTRASSQGLAELILSTPQPADWGIVAPTYRAAWTTCVEGESGILAALGTSAGEVKNGTSRLIAYAHRSYGEIGLRSGHVIYVDSANDGALRVQGKNLTACWCSEIGLWLKWATAWDESIAYAVRRGVSKIIADGTPKVSRPAAKLIRRLLRDEPGVIVRRLRTIDNLANLSQTFYNAVVAKASGTRLERQELEGELLDDVENALWTRDLLENLQEDGVPGAFPDEGTTGLRSVTVGVDPADGTEDGDEQAYTVCGQGGDNRLYVVESWGGRIGPVAFLKRAVQAADRWNGSIVLEKNHGGAYLVATLQQVMRDLDITVPYRVVHASQAKRTRAEPVAALYERGVVRHVNGPHVDLEDQMVTFTGEPGERSPDRLDSLCIAEGTPVITAGGEIPIERVRAGDQVWTRQGWKPVTAAACTKRGAEVMTVELSDGRKLTGTPDHRIWVEEKGWSRLDTLVWGDRLSGWKSLPSPSSTGASLTSATPAATSERTASTTRRRAAAASRRSTAISGRTRTPARKSRPAGTSTTTTTTRSTTIRPTWLPSPLASTPASIRASSAECRSITLSGSGLSLPSGTARPQGWPGTPRTAGAPGRTGNRSTPRRAPSAARSSWPSSTSPAGPKRTTGTAQGAASTGAASRSTWRLSPARSAAPSSAGTSTTRISVAPAHVHVVRSYASAEPQNVYDLTVADAHEFAAAGVIVHNCWALTPFLNYTFDFSGKPQVRGPRNWSATADLQRIGAQADRRRVPGQEREPSRDSWDADTFAPQEDVRPTRRNVRSWG